MMKHPEWFGYFDSHSDTPTYDPMQDAPCLICLKSWTLNDVKTLSLMRVGDERSYFYRVHKTCYENLSEHDRDTYDWSLIDNLPQVSE